MLRSNPDSNIVFLEDRYSLAILSILFSTPNDGATPNYEALKDFIRWSSPKGYDVDEIQREFIPIVLELYNFISSIPRPQRGL